MKKLLKGNGNTNKGKNYQLKQKGISYDIKWTVVNAKHC